jgi:hypothetical protein
VNTSGFIHFTPFSKPFHTALLQTRAQELNGSGNKDTKYRDAVFLAA